MFCSSDSKKTLYFLLDYLTDPQVKILRDNGFIDNMIIVSRVPCSCSGLPAGAMRFEVFCRYDVEWKDSICCRFIHLCFASYSPWKENKRAHCQYRGARRADADSKKGVLWHSPTTSSRTSFQCSSLPFSWIIVTVILRWMPCSNKAT